MDCISEGNMKAGKRIIIIGGVAGGASCATRARRLSEEAEILLIEKGPYVSFANCGLPYYVGNVIKREEALLVATPELFKKRFKIDVRVRSEVEAIDRKNCEVEIVEAETGRRYREKYDALVLSPGASPIKPPVPGVDLPGIFTVRNIPDIREVKGWIKNYAVGRAMVVGGGFIGLEMTENLAGLGIEVSIAEMQQQVMPLMDAEMIGPVHDELGRHGVTLRLGDAVSGFDRLPDGSISIRMLSGAKEMADLVILAVGVRPETKLARESGLDIGEFGGIRVNEQMLTNDPKIWAVGDAVEVQDFVTGRWALMPLAGPANRQGRIAADVIFGRDRTFRGGQGTMVCGVFGLRLASTGPSEKALNRAGLWEKCEKVYLHPLNHATYFPGAKQMSLKLIFSKSDGRVVSAQAVGQDGVEKRIDVISMAIQKNATVFDLEEAELSYAPQFGAARDPVNMAGMIAANVIRGDARVAHWEELGNSDAFILDVRDSSEFRKGHVGNAVNVPLNDLRARMEELPKEREIWTYCQVGQRSYYASRVLSQHRFAVKNLSGGYKTHQLRNRATGLKKTNDE
ncbi:MAG: FAD-dependent oxidoreductase [Syntrophobacteraceae bacterium]|nr:FAD-dependent oxidoreductase [Syntrophobacteraceae bacterium]